MTISHCATEKQRQWLQSCRTFAAPMHGNSVYAESYCSSPQAGQTELWRTCSGQGNKASLNA